MTSGSVTRVVAHRELTTGRIDPHLFGSFVEHMGRTVYTGIYEPGHSQADEAGLRGDVIDAVRQLGVTCVRYPGGNFVSSHDWRDAVGPVGQRPRRLELAWRAVETNEFGLAEFMHWAQQAKVEPMLAVNLGTAGIREAVALLEYCNHPSGTRESELRRSHGRDDPYDVNLWCLGNEMDGWWQIGHKGADEYGRLAAETAKAMRCVDPTIRLASCGSSKSDQPTFPDWDLATLRHTYPYVDYLAVHQYYGGQHLGLPAFLAQAQDFDRYLSALTAVCDVVRAEQRSSKTLLLSVDEWGVWDFQDGTIPDAATPWQVAPAFSEQVYSMRDALLFASMLTTMVRHADRVGIACQSLLTNISACIMTAPGGGVWLQPTFYPFAQLAEFAGARVLRAAPVGPTYDAGPELAVPLVDCVVVHDEVRRRIGVFAINRDDAEQMLQVSLGGFERCAITSHTVMCAPAAATNREDHDAVRPQPCNTAIMAGELVLTALPALSWTAIKINY